MERLDRAMSPEAVAGPRYTPERMSYIDR
jgi:hypothetical protein